MNGQSESSSETGKSQGFTIQAEPAVFNTGPLGFHRYAGNYLDAARLIEIGDSYSPVPYYLYCRSLELGLKAYLLASEIPEKELRRRVGHDLKKALREACKLGLANHVEFSREQILNFLIANKHYKGKGFEYYQLKTLLDRLRGEHKLPNLDVFDEALQILLDGIKDVCIDA